MFIPVQITDIIGIVGAIIGVLLYCPQIIRAYQTKSTIDISWGTYWLIFINDFLWTLYGLGHDIWIIFGANLISFFLCLIILVQKRKYDSISRRLS